MIIRIRLIVIKDVLIVGDEEERVGNALFFRYWLDVLEEIFIDLSNKWVVMGAIIKEEDKSPFNELEDAEINDILNNGMNMLNVQVIGE